MGAVFVVLGVVSFALGYAVQRLGDDSGVALMLMSCTLLVGAIIIDSVNKFIRETKRR